MAAHAFCVRTPSETLTPRERQILELVADAASNRVIAHSLRLSEMTVRRHLSNIFDKTGMSSRLELAVRHLHFRHQAEIAALSHALAA